MTPLERELQIATHAAWSLVLLGLVLRGRWTLSRFFAAYVALGVVTIPMYLWWPEQFYHQWFYLTKQTGFDVLKFGVAIEVGWLSFRSFPGARYTALVMALIILAATAVAAAAVPVGPDAWEWDVVVTHFFPRIKTGTIWLFAVILVVARWYHVPLHPFHTAILTSLAVYLGLGNVIVWLWNGGQGVFGADTELLNATDLVSENLIVLCWIYAAWRRESAAAVAHRHTLTRLETPLAAAGVAS